MEKEASGLCAAKTRLIHTLLDTAFLPDNNNYFCNNTQPANVIDQSVLVVKYIMENISYDLNKKEMFTAFRP